MPQINFSKTIKHSSAAFTVLAIEKLVDSFDLTETCNDDITFDDDEHRMHPYNDQVLQLLVWMLADNCNSLPMESLAYSLRNTPTLARRSHLFKQALTTSRGQEDGEKIMVLIDMFHLGIFDWLKSYFFAQRILDNTGVNLRSIDIKRHPVTIVEVLMSYISFKIFKK